MNKLPEIFIIPKCVRIKMIFFFFAMGTWACMSGFSAFKLFELYSLHLYSIQIFCCWECATCCQDSCRMSKNTERVQAWIASVWNKNLVEKCNWSMEELFSACVPLFAMQFLCLLHLRTKAMLFERKAFSLHKIDTFLPYGLSGCVFFLCLGIFYMFRPNMSFVAPVQEKVVVGLFFLGAILCLSFSWLFHTVYCHSEGVSRLFSK